MTSICNVYCTAYAPFCRRTIAGDLNKSIDRTLFGKLNVALDDFIDMKEEGEGDEEEGEEEEVKGIEVIQPLFFFLSLGQNFYLYPPHYDAVFLFFSLSLYFSLSPSLFHYLPLSPTLSKINTLCPSVCCSVRRR